MAHKITWSLKAIESFVENVEYLESVWTKKEVDNFITTVKRRIQLISNYPHLGSLTYKRKNVRKTVIHKRVILFYRPRPMKREVELIRFWATRQNPRRLRS